MFPQERTPFFRMTGVTGFIQRRPEQQRGRAGPVAGVTIAAAQLAEAHRVTGGLEELRALFQVTLETHVGLGHRVEHGVVRRVDGVAIGTGEAVDLVCTALPGDVAATRVALETHGILDCRGLVRLGTEIQDGGALFSGSDLADVSARLQGFFHEHGTPDTRSMAGLALQSGKRHTRIALHGMFGLEDVENGVFFILVVALDTGVGALG